MSTSAVAERNIWIANLMRMSVRAENNLVAHVGAVCSDIIVLEQQEIVQYCRIDTRCEPCSSLQ